jgi:exodeoxyribonuclease VII small subunit
MAKKASKSSVETYEEMYGQLEMLVERLESGVLPLDELLRLYEQGITLASACQRLLDEAEVRVQQLQEGA